MAIPANTMDINNVRKIIHQVGANTNAMASGGTSPIFNGASSGTSQKGPSGFSPRKPGKKAASGLKRKG